MATIDGRLEMPNLGIRMLSWSMQAQRMDRFFRVKLRTISGFKRENRIRSYKYRKTLHPPA